MFPELGDTFTCPSSFEVSSNLSSDLIHWAPCHFLKTERTNGTFCQMAEGVCTTGCYQHRITYFPICKCLINRFDFINMNIKLHLKLESRYLFLFLKFLILSQAHKQSNSEITSSCLFRVHVADLNWGTQINGKSNIRPTYNPPPCPRNGLCVNYNQRHFHCCLPLSLCLAFSTCFLKSQSIVDTGSSIEINALGTLF